MVPMLPAIHLEIGRTTLEYMIVRDLEVRAQPAVARASRRRVPTLAQRSSECPLG